MKLCIKPEDKIYGAIKNLIDKQNVTLSLFGPIFKDDQFAQELAYSPLCRMGFLERKKQIFTSTYSPKKCELLEDKTIILYDELPVKT